MSPLDADFANNRMFSSKKSVTDLSNPILFESSSSDESNTSTLSSQSFQQHEQQQQNRKGNATQYFPLSHASNYNTPDKKRIDNQQAKSQHDVEEGTLQLSSDFVSFPSTVFSSLSVSSNTSSFYSDEDMEVLYIPPVYLSIYKLHGDTSTGYDDRENDADDEYGSDDEVSFDQDDMGSAPHHENKVENNMSEEKSILNRDCPLKMVKVEQSTKNFAAVLSSDDLTDTLRYFTDDEEELDCNYFDAYNMQDMFPAGGLESSMARPSQLFKKNIWLKYSKHRLERSKPTILKKKKRAPRPLF